MTTLTCVVLTGALYILCGCGSRSPEPKAIRTFDVDTSYGTLSFRGAIDLAERGSEYEYRTHLDVTFHSNRRVNRVPIVDLIAWRFAATVPRDDSGPWRALHEESRPIIVRLTQDGQTAHLPDETFHLPKTLVAEARLVGVAVLDGHFMWPIPVNLK